MREMAPGGYNAADVEHRWYKAWEDAGLLQPEKDSDKPTYSITIPPPNITGSLHMGHALCYSIQDLLGRYYRMRGHNVMILPGQDHAGIATQSVVDKNLRKQGTSATQLGRERFLEKVWEWRSESGDTILSQLRSLGCAFDWSRLRFTLDDHYHEAVVTVFIDWFERGLIYRGLRVVNWDIALKTSVSDIETERQEVNGALYHIKYPFKDGSGHVTIATTRPETMLADVAVAVHPSDARYKGLVGKTLVLPLTGREIPLIEDLHPDPEFGTGAVKITPAHDANDFEVGQRHNLPILTMMDEAGKVTELGGKYQGKDRLQARKQVVADLEASGALEKVESHTVAVMVSQRSGEIIEPLASEQWFVSQAELAKPAAQAVKDGKVSFFPERYTGIYLDWLENIRDWCVSRQLWWGHRIPVYYTEDGTAIAAKSWEDAQQKAGEKPIVRQEEDVLDTWFSSGLWPFATLGWPDQTQDLKDYYPTNVLVTARDIIFLWVARMVMMGLDYVQDIPFRHVFIYATVLTEDGRRMSKSLGTGVDPMDVINEKGADALRYTLLSQTGENQDLRYSETRTNDARNFCNKVWNASRFVFMNLDGYQGKEPQNLEVFDQWLLSRLAKCEKTVSTSYESYNVQAAIAALYQFFWNDLCDWYIEVSKARLQDPATKATPQWVLVTALKTFLKMLHPAMPHITEEVYACMPVEGKKDFLMQETWPTVPATYINDESEAQVEKWIAHTRAIRALRASIGLAALKKIPVVYAQGDLEGGESVIASQAWVEKIEPGTSEAQNVSTTSLGVDFYLPVEGLVDTEQELARLTKEEAKTSAELVKVQLRLANPQFVERAKPEVVEKERQTAAELEDNLEKIRARIELFSA